MRSRKDIAIIGMALRFPGANNIETFWRNVSGGVESISEFSADDLKTRGIDSSVINDTCYVKRAGIIEGADLFDAGFFGYSKNDAEFTDPQARVFLECAWEALENSGYVPEKFDRKVGVYGSAYASNYLVKNLSGYVEENSKTNNEFYTLYQCVNDYLATNVAYRLNLNGPSFSVQTWCTSAMVAIHLACQSLRNNECSMALAGGVQIRFPQEGYFARDGYSHDGHCRSFDKEANGMVAGSGAGIVVLKTLEDALRDGDNIYAVIKGSSVNNDGANGQKLSYHGITSQGIHNAATEALRDAGIEPRTIQYMEGHGGATELADRIEFSALTKAYSSAENSRCAIGSVRPNIGHIGNASGAAAVIKTALALSKEVIPPSINFKELSHFNSKRASIFYVNTAPESWSPGLPKRAAINSYGVGGTNTHMILEESPPARPSGPGRSSLLFTFSAKTPTALDSIIKNVREYIENNPDTSLADIAYTLNVGRKDLSYRKAMLIPASDDVIHGFDELLSIQPSFVSEPPPSVVFLFPGYGYPYDGAFQLYFSEPDFRKHLDICEGICRELMGIALLDVLHPSAASEYKLNRGHNEMKVLQSATFSVQYAMARMLMEWGIHPKSVGGYNLGELVAGCIADVFTLDQAFSLIAGGNPTGIANKPRTPSIPYLSTSTGEWILESITKDASFWIEATKQVAPAERSIPGIFNNKGYAIVEVMPESSCCGVDIIIELWRKGVAVNWTNFYRHETRNRLPLPTYPFERQRYWIEPLKRVEDRSGSSLRLAKRPDISEWLYVPIWKQSRSLTRLDLPAMLESTNSTWMVFYDSSNNGVEVIERLRSLNQTVITVSKANAFGNPSVHDFWINPKEVHDYQKLSEVLEKANLLPERIISLWNISQTEKENSSVDQISDAQDRGFYSLLYITQAFGEKYSSKQLSICIVTNHVQKVTGDEAVMPEKATLLGLIRVIELEYRSIRCASIDIDVWNPQVVENLLVDVVREAGMQHVAYRGLYQWKQVIEQVPSQDDVNSVCLMPHGTYLITGGLGGMGLVLSEHIIHHAGKANIVLINRSSFPAKEEWDHWLQTHGPTNVISRQILKLQQFELSGSSVLVLHADVSDQEAMRKSIDFVRARFGRINGVLHLAGVSGGGLEIGQGVLQYRTREQVENVFASKVYGTAILASLLDLDDLDFMVLGSSNSSVIGFYGQGDYGAANAYLDAFAHSQSSKKARVVSINWDLWSEAGMALSASVSRGERVIDDDALRNGILNTEGGKLFNRCLMLNAPQVVVSTRDIHQVIDANDKIIQSAKAFLAKSVERNFAKPYVAPATELEKELSKMWASLFGVEKIGRHDHFLVDLGGHSLLAVRFLNRLHTIKSGIKVSLRDLFKHATIEQLAKHIELSAEKGGGVPAYSCDDIAAMPRNDSMAVLEKYLRDVITEGLESTLQELPDDGNLADVDLEGLVKHISWYVKKDFNLMFFGHEIQSSTSVTSLAGKLLEEVKKYVTSQKSRATTPLTDVKWVIPRNVSAEPKNLYQKNKRMVFILSSPRSGSTLLRLMLAGHSKLFSPPELGLLIYDDMSDWYRHFVSAYSVSEMVRSGLISTLMELKDIQYAEARAEMNAMVENNLQTHQIYQLIQELVGAKTLVDKAPSYAYDTKILGRAEKIFDDARYIYLYRHPYSVIESFARERFHKIHPDEKEEYDPHQLGEYVWNLTNANILDFFHSIDPKRYHFVQYEKLVTNTAQVMSGLCGFLDVPFEESVLYPYEGNRMITGSGDPNIFLHDKIERNLGDKWKTIKLPIALSRKTRDLASRLGYILPNDREYHSLDTTTSTEKLKQQLADLNNLSASEIDALLKTML